MAKNIKIEKPEVKEVKISKPEINDIVVCGLGAAGSNTFIHLLYAYPAVNMTGVDFDKVEIRNIDPGTQPYEKMDLNRPKTQAFQRIAMAIKKKRVNVKNEKINSTNDLIKIVPDIRKTLFIDAFDNAESRNLFLGLKNSNVIHIGFSANLCGEAVWDETFTPMVASKKDEAIDVCEMAIARPFIFSLTSLASLAIVGFMEKGEKVNLYFDRHLTIRKF